MFPSYMRLDGDPVRPDSEDQDPGKTLRDLGTTYQQKRQLLEASDRPVQGIFEVIDSNNSLNAEKVRNLTASNFQDKTSQMGTDIVRIGEHMQSMLRILGSKKHMNLQSKILDADRSVRIDAESVEVLQRSVEDSRKVQDERFDVLAKGSILKGVLQESQAGIVSAQFNFLS